MTGDLGYIKKVKLRRVKSNEEQACRLALFLLYKIIDRLEIILKYSKVL